MGMAYESNSIFWIEVEKVVPNPFQPRREFDPNKLQELADSIRMYGILQPLVVTRREIMGEHGAFTTEYELIAGERRLRASKLAGLTQVPVIIRSGEESQLMKLELAIIENLQREDLNPVDRALAFKQLAEQFGLSHGQVGEKVGRSREYVSNSIRLLLLPEEVLNALRRNDISDGHARTLLMLSDRPAEQDVVFREILLKKLSVREVERIARKIATERVRRPGADTDPELIDIERQFTETFGTRVEIKKTEFGGKLMIDYFAPEDLRKVLDIVRKGEMILTKETGSQVLARIEDATPLEPVSPVTPVSIPPTYQPTQTPSQTIPQESVPAVFANPIPEPIIPVTAPTPIPAPAPVLVASEPVLREEVFTRHDSLYVPETPVSETDAHTGYDETQEMHEILEKVASVQQSFVPVPSEPVPTAVSTSPEPQKTQDEAELYSIKNFSL